MIGEGRAATRLYLLVIAGGWLGISGQIRASGAEIFRWDPLEAGCRFTQAPLERVQLCAWIFPSRGRLLFFAQRAAGSAFRWCGSLHPAGRHANVALECMVEGRL